MVRRWPGLKLLHCVNASENWFAAASTTFAPCRYCNASPCGYASEKLSSDSGVGTWKIPLGEASTMPSDRPSVGMAPLTRRSLRVTGVVVG